MLRPPCLYQTAGQTWGGGNVNIHTIHYTVDTVPWAGVQTIQIPNAAAALEPMSQQPKYIHIP